MCKGQVTQMSRGQMKYSGCIDFETRKTRSTYGSDREFSVDDNPGPEYELVRINDYRTGG